jgi:ParB family chromosome partitioning protein
MLGRGLNSLIPQKVTTSPVLKNVAPEDKGRVYEIPLELIAPNPKQPREIFNHLDLEGLISSIKEHGVLQPIVVTKINDTQYELIAGERRLRASKFAGLKTIPAIVRAAKEQEKLELALLENIQRKDLNAIEEAKAYKRLMDEFNLTQETVAMRIGKARSTVANILRLLSLPQEIQKAILDEKINTSQARIIAGLPDEKLQMQMFKKIIAGVMNVRQAEEESKKAKKQESKKTIDPNLTTKEEIIRAALGTKAEIKKYGNKGQIVISFYSEEELEGIIRKLAEL